ncbi:MAG: glycerol acyltransferase [Bacillota bacterium]|nr:glycerol acyltransferase [Bacillota bacterium]
MNFYGAFFKWMQAIVRIFHPKYSVHIPNEKGPVVYVCHHQNLFGPFITMLWFPKSIHMWVLHVFLDQSSCFQHYSDYTFTKRFKWNKVLAKICASPISFFIPKLLNSARSIPVYRGSRRIVTTFKQSIEALLAGEKMVICPDIDYSDPSSTTKEMYDGFLFLEKYFYQKTGKHLCFIPIYVSRRKRGIVADQKIYFSDGKSFNEERKVIYKMIQTNLNDLAKKCGDV